jgi:hypothetical protein
MKIRGSIYGKSRSRWKCGQDSAAHRFPHTLNPSDDGWGGKCQLADFLAGNKGIGLADRDRDQTNLCRRRDIEVNHPHARESG